MSDPKKSMREFDYFNEHVRAASMDQLASKDGVPDTVAESATSFVELRKRARRVTLISMLFVSVAGWFFWDYRDMVGYAFSSPRPPQLLGDASTLTPRDVPHNSYVEISGITEHRGLMRKVVRGLGISRKEYWYFRLLGSQGVFIEVPPEKEHYGATTEVTVSGRALDPETSGLYADFIKEYDAKFHPEHREELRIIQVGLEPGDGRAQFILVGLVLIAILGFNIVTLMRVFRAAKKLDNVGLIRP